MRDHPPAPRTEVERLHGVRACLGAAAEHKELPSDDGACCVVERLRNTAERGQPTCGGREREDARC